jgi:hypothetical protein
VPPQWPRASADRDGQCDRREREAAARSRVAEHVLQVEREQEELREPDRGDHAGDQVRGGKAVPAEDSEGHEGSRLACEKSRSDLIVASATFQLAAHHDPRYAPKNGA